MNRSHHEEVLVQSRQADLSTIEGYNPTIIDDLLFLDAWEGGRVTSLSAFFRARQIRRVNPVRAVEGK
jgi:hypothetical protein